MEAKPLFPYMDEINAAVAAAKASKSGSSSPSLSILTAPATTITYDKVSPWHIYIPLPCVRSALRSETLLVPHLCI